MKKTSNELLESILLALNDLNETVKIGFANVGNFGDVTNQSSPTAKGIRRRHFTSQEKETADQTKLVVPLDATTPPNINDLIQRYVSEQLALKADPTLKQWDISDDDFDDEAPFEDVQFVDNPRFKGHYLDDSTQSQGDTTPAVDVDSKADSVVPSVDSGDVSKPVDKQLDSLSTD